MRHLRLNYLLAVIAITSVSERSVHAQAVYCTNCSSELTQLYNYAQLVEQLAKQASILETNIKQYQNMQTNTTPLTFTQWGSATQDLAQINALLSRATSLSFASANLDTQFSQKYQDYNGYLASNPGSSAFAGKYQNWSQQTNDSALQTLKAAGLQSSQMTGDEEAIIQNLQSQTAGVVGNLDGIQTLAQVGISNIRQIQKLRQLVMADLSMKANFQQRDQDEKTSQQAAWRNFLKTQTIPTTGGQRF